MRQRARPSGPAGLLPLALMLVLSPRPPRLQAQELPDSLVVLDSVVVSVTRSPAALGQSPYAVSLLRGGELQLGNAGVSLEEALQALPGVQIQNRFNYSVGEKISIRGFGARSQFGVRGVKLLVDGIPATLPDGQGTLDHLDVGSLGRVEALRGPSSALYGNGAGGVLSFETRPPPLSGTRQEARAVLGEDGLFRFQATTSGTTGKTGYVISLSTLHYDGFRSNPEAPGEAYGVSDRVTLNGQVTTPVAGGSLRITANAFDLSSENPGQLPRDLLHEENLQAWGFNVRQGTRKDVRQGQLGASWRGEVGGLNGRLVAWGLARELDNPIPPRVVDLDRVAGGVRALVFNERARRPGDVEWLVGAELELQRDDRLNHENEQGARGALTLDQLERVRGLGVFLQVRTFFSDRLSAVGALRHDRFRFEAEDHLVTAGNEDDSGTRVMSAWSPSIGLHFQASEGVALYANVATALTTPTTTELANQPSGRGGFNPELDPVRSLTAELGVRGHAGSRVGYEAAAFLTGLRDELIAFEDPVQEGRTFFRNAGSSTYTGVEGALSLSLRDGVSARVSYTYVNARFDDFRADGDVFDDHDVPGLAPHRLDGLVRVTRGTWFGEARGDYVGRVPVDNANSAFADGYGLLDVRTGLDGAPLGMLELSPFVGVSNVFDTRYAASVAVNAFGGRFYDPGPGRAFFVGLSAAYSGGR